MRINPRRPRFMLAILSLTWVLAASPARADFALSDNLGETTGGAETATGDSWLTAGFGTGDSAVTLTSVTLLLANSSPASTVGVAEVDLFTDGGLQPGSLVASLTSPTLDSGTAAAATFTSGTGVDLAANSSYWVVLKATSGSFDWSWALTTPTSGATGFQGTWGSSDDAGQTWFTYDSYPLQMTVTASAAAVPEPGTLVLCGIGLVSLGLSRVLRKLARASGQADGADDV